MIDRLKQEKKNIERNIEAVHTLYASYPRTYTLQSLFRVENSLVERLHEIYTLIRMVEKK